MIDPRMEARRAPAEAGVFVGWVSPLSQLRDGEIFDAGYREIVVNERTAREFVCGGFSVVNGDPVTLLEVGRGDGWVQLQWRPVGGVEHAAGTYSWQTTDDALREAA